MRAEDLQIRRAGKNCFRASPGINVAFSDLVSEGDVSLQALVELSQRQLPCVAKVFMEKIMSDARYYVVGDHDVWMIKFKDGEYPQLPKFFRHRSAIALMNPRGEATTTSDRST